jgi:thiol-disulfide isomerase/thioredoxin
MIAALGFSAFALAATLFYGWLLLHLRRSQDRIVARLDGLAHRLAAQRAAAAAPVPVPSGPARLAPDFALPALDGRIVSLSNLLAAGKRTLLNFTDPKCGPCYELLADVGGWEGAYGDRLTIVTVSGGDPRQNAMLAREYGLGTVLLQQEHEVADLLGLPMIPGAVLIEPDGRMTDSTTGAHRVRQLVADALGLVVPPPDVKTGETLRPGQRVGELRRPDLDGNPIDLGERRAEPTLLLFWSPGCSHCRDLLPTMREWDADPHGPRMVVVTSGPVGLSREAGLRAPMIQDDQGELKQTFGVRGTPAAVLIDGNGRVASEVAGGAKSVRALVAHRFGAATATAA